MTLLPVESLPAPEAPTRERVLALVAGRAWTPAELGQALGVDRKTAEYHLHHLHRHGMVAERRVHGQRRFALARGAPQAFATAPRARTRYRVAKLVEEQGIVGLDEAARALGISPSLAAYHARQLAEQGVVRVRRDARRIVLQAKGLAYQALEDGPAG